MPTTTKDINYLPFLHLLFSSSKDMDDFDHTALADLVFRGIIQIYINEHHITRLANSYAATLIFKNTDFEKTLNREKAYDFFIGRHRRNGDSRFHIGYDDFKECLAKLNTFSPTIISSTKPLTDELLQSITLSIITSPKKPDKIADRDLKGRLTAWRATIINKTLPVIKEMEHPEIMKPLLQMCRMINPEGMENLNHTLSILRPKPPEDRIPMQIARVLIEQYPKHGPQSYDFGTVEEVTDSVNRHLHTNFSSTQVGRILNRELNLKTQKVHPGNMHLIVPLKDLGSIRKEV